MVRPRGAGEGRNAASTRECDVDVYVKASLRSPTLPWLQRASLAPRRALCRRILRFPARLREQTRSSAPPLVVNESPRRGGQAAAAAAKNGVEAVSVYNMATSLLPFLSCSAILQAFKVPVLQL